MSQLKTMSGVGSMLFHVMDEVESKGFLWYLRGNVGVTEVSLTEVGTSILVEEECR